jgi:hypothetical protein
VGYGGVLGMTDVIYGKRGKKGEGHDRRGMFGHVIEHCRIGRYVLQLEVSSLAAQAVP